MKEVEKELKVRWNYKKLRHLKWVYYKVRHDKNYVKLRQVLQIAMIITKCDVSKHAFDHEC